jgi:polyphosphate kinase
MQFVTSQMQVNAKDVVEVDGILGISALSELYDAIPHSSLKYTPYEVRFPERISDYGGDCFAAIRAKDIVVHHPFESFDVVVQFLEQAADDPEVVSIKQTLYRTSKDSPIVKALIEAAENGKSVTALVELKARFDEEANIKWGSMLQEEGVEVIYGVPDFKIHAKLCLIERMEKNKKVFYANIATGNYNEKTAHTYSDQALFTCNESVTKDVERVLDYIAKPIAQPLLKNLVISPFSTRKFFLKQIEREIKNAEKGKPAAIFLKMNSLVDDVLIRKLYDASNVGVKCRLVIRGICNPLAQTRPSRRSTV